MRYVSLMVLLVLLSLEASAGNLPAIHTLLGRTWMFFMPVEAELSAGWSDGWASLPVSTALVNASIALEPTFRWRRGRFLISLPLDVAHRETFDASLNETALDGNLQLRVRVVKGLFIEMRGGAQWRLRPNWPDQYQPVLGPTGEPTGERLGTDRFSRWDVHAEGAVQIELAKRYHLDIQGGFKRRVYKQDPSYDPILRPTHLIPGDRDDGWGAVVFRGKAWKVYRFSVRGKVELLSYHFELARDAGTGLTHGEPGDLPANPLLKELRIGLDHRSSLWIPSIRLRVLATFGLKSNQDLHAGYYTYNAINGGIGLRNRPIKGLSLSASYQVTWRIYTDDGYQAGPDNPALEEDDVRATLLHDIRGEIGYSMLDGWVEPFVAVRWRMNQTNYPDYVPWIFPASAPYTIDFDWSWVVGTAGIRCSL